MWCIILVQRSSSLLPSKTKGIAFARTNRTQTCWVIFTAEVIETMSCGIYHYCIYEQHKVVKCLARQKILSGHVAFNRTSNLHLYVSLCNYPARGSQDSRKISMCLLSVHATFTLAILFSIILRPFVLCQSTDSNARSYMHLFYKIIWL